MDKIKSAGRQLSINTKQAQPQINNTQSLSENHSKAGHHECWSTGQRYTLELERGLDISLPSLKQATAKQPLSSQFSTALSVRNKILISRFLSKLVMAEAFVVKSPSLQEQYLTFMQSLSMDELKYKEVLRQSTRMPAQTAQLTNTSHNQKINRQVNEDLKRVRSFIQQHFCSLHRKPVSEKIGCEREEPSLIKLPKQSQLRKATSSIKTKRVLKLQIKQWEAQRTAEEAKYQSIKVPPSQGDKHLNQGQRHKMGLEYLKHSRKCGLQSIERHQKSGGKVRLVRQIIHHWRVDNRYLRISTEGKDYGLANNKIKVSKLIRRTPSSRGTQNDLLQSL